MWSNRFIFTCISLDITTIPTAKPQAPTGPAAGPTKTTGGIYGHTSIYRALPYCTSRMLLYLQTEGKTFHQQNRCNRLYSNTCFIAGWGRTCNISKVCLRASLLRPCIKCSQRWGRCRRVPPSPQALQACSYIRPSK